MSELNGDVAARVLDVQRRFDPRMAAELPPHVTITGSSGVGPISPDTTEDELIAALEARRRGEPRRSPCNSSRRCSSCKAPWS